MVHRPIRFFYLKTVRQRATPHQIAGGMAVGVLVALACPPVFLHVFIALAAATILNVNRVAAFIGVWLSNPLTVLPILAFQIRIGETVTGKRIQLLPNDDQTFADVVQALDRGTVLVYVVGAVISAAIGAIVSYYITRNLVIRYRQRRARANDSTRIVAKGHNI